MKTLLTAAAALGLCAIAGAASAADAVGTITLNGHVGSACTVIQGGSGTTFGATFDLGELTDGSTGHLRSDIKAGSPISGLTFNFTLVCSGANEGVSVRSTALTNAATAPTGYSNAVDFTGNAHFLLVSSGGASTLDVANLTTAAAATTNSFGASNFLQNVNNNVVVSAYSFAAHGGDNLLVAGAYAGSIVVDITPS